MRRVGAILGLLCIFWYGCSDEPRGKRGIRAAQGDVLVAIEAPTVRLGRLPTNSTAAATFRVVNSSGVPVKLKLVRASCSCLDVTVPSSELGPGRTATIEMSTKVENRSDVPELGALIRAASPDERRQDFLVTMSYEPDLEYEVWPENLMIACREGQERAATVFIRPGADGDVRILSAEVERLPGVRVSSIGTYRSTGGEGRVIRLELKGVERGRFAGGLRCLTSNEIYPEFGVYIAFRVDPKLEMIPPGFVLSPSNSSSTVQIKGHESGLRAVLNTPVEGLNISTVDDGTSLIVTVTADRSQLAHAWGDTSVDLVDAQGDVVETIKLVWLGR